MEAFSFSIEMQNSYAYTFLQNKKKKTERKKEINNKQKKKEPVDEMTILIKPSSLASHTIQTANIEYKNENKTTK